MLSGTIKNGPLPVIVDTTIQGPSLNGSNTQILPDQKDDLNKEYFCCINPNCKKLDIIDSIDALIEQYTILKSNINDYFRFYNHGTTSFDVLVKYYKETANKLKSNNSNINNACIRAMEINLLKNLDSSFCSLKGPTIDQSEKNEGSIQDPINLDRPEKMDTSKTASIFDQLGITIDPVTSSTPSSPNIPSSNKFPIKIFTGSLPYKKNIEESKKDNSKPSLQGPFFSSESKKNPQERKKSMKVPTRGIKRSASHFNINLPLGYVKIGMFIKTDIKIFDVLLEGHIQRKLLNKKVTILQINTLREYDVDYNENWDIDINKGFYKRPYKDLKPIEGGELLGPFCSLQKVKRTV